VELYWRHLKGKIRNLPTSDDFVNIKESVLDIIAGISIDTIFNWMLKALEK
jgi:hypothetical protein